MSGQVKFIHSNSICTNGHSERQFSHRSHSHRLQSPESPAPTTVTGVTRTNSNHQSHPHQPSNRSQSHRPQSPESPAPTTVTGVSRTDYHYYETHLNIHNKHNLQLQWNRSESINGTGKRSSLTGTYARFAYR